MRIIAGKYKGRALYTPNSNHTRPTSGRVRESLFSILLARNPKLFVGANILDLFSGSGALGLEALSRGASSVLFYENSKKVCHIIEKNIQMLDVARQCRIISADATYLVQNKKPQKFDVVFADPPYGKKLAEQALAKLMDDDWLADDATLVVEEAADQTLDLPQGLVLLDRRQYSGTAIHIIAARET